MLFHVLHKDISSLLLTVFNCAAKMDLRLAICNVMATQILNLACGVNDFVD